MTDYEFDKLKTIIKHIGLRVITIQHGKIVTNTNIHWNPYIDSRDSLDLIVEFKVSITYDKKGMCIVGCKNKHIILDHPTTEYVMGAVVDVVYNSLVE